MTTMNLRAEYLRLRRKGFRAIEAWHDARANVAFAQLELDDVVRFRVEPDECSTVDDLVGDCAAPGTRAYAAIAAKVERDGVWGIITEVRCRCCGNWTHVDSVWGFVGDDFVDCGYDADLRRAAVRAHEEAQP